MMKRILLLATCLSLSGCYSLKFNSDQLDDGSVYFTPVSGTHEEHFKETESVGFLLGGLIPLGSPNPAAAIGKYIGSGRKVANFKVTAEENFLDGLLTDLTLGIYSPLTITYEGDVVKPRPSKHATKQDPLGTAGSASTNNNNNNNNIVVNTGTSAGNAVTAIPVILSLTATPAAVRAGQRTALTVNATSPSGKALHYNWSATGGTLTSTAGNVTFWTAPEQPGNYSVVVSVSDDAGGQAAGAANVAVGN